jgi:hypothetical protein
MGNATGALTKIAAFTEATYNTTPGSPDGRLLAVQTFGLKAVENRTADPTLSGYRGQARTTADRRNVSGSIQVSVAPEDIGFWLTHLIGKPTVTGTGPYTHSFAVDPDGAGALPAGALFETDFGAGISAPGRYVRYSGNRLSQATLQLPSSGHPTLSMDWLGADFDATAEAALDSTLTDTGHKAWNAKQVALELDDGTTSVCFESFSAVFGNDLDADRYCVGNGGVRHDLPEGQFIASGQGTIYFDTPALMNKALNDTDAKIKVTLSRGNGLGAADNESLVITIPLAVFAANTPAIDGPKGLKLDANWTAHRSTGEIGITAVLKNALAAVY